MTGEKTETEYKANMDAVKLRAIAVEFMEKATPKGEWFALPPKDLIELIDAYQSALDRIKYLEERYLMVEFEGVKKDL